METPPPPYRDQRKVDEEHLDLLSIMHFVGAGLAVLGILFLCAHYALMSTVFMNPQNLRSMLPPQPGSSPVPFPPNFPPAHFFEIFRWFYVIFGVFFVVSGVLNVMSALWLRARVNRTGSIAVAILNCFHLPLGTILGIFTIIVLSRDSVRRIYGE